MFASKRVLIGVALTAASVVPITSGAQTVPAAPTVHLQPAWRPVSGSLATPSSVTTYSTNMATASNGSVTVASGSPYYGVSPLYRSSATTTFTPAAGMVSAPAPWDTTGRPAIVPDQMIRPMVSTPTGPVPAAPTAPVAPLAPQTPVSNAGTQAMPINAPMIPSAPATPSAPAVAPSAQPAVAPANPQPFVDSGVFVQGGQSWIDIDVTPYTSRFPAAANADKSIREWISRKIDPSSWMGGEVSSLVVTPERVRIYHTQSVQQQVRDLLGRFLYYTPGEFQTRVQVVNVRNPRWRSEAGSVLSPVGGSGKIWVGNIEDVASISSAISTRDSGTMLVNEDVVVFNGQRLHLGWSPTAGRDPDPSRTGKPVEEGVVVNVSPLIDSDAATIEVDLSAAARRDVQQSQSFFRSNNSAGSPQVEEGSLRELVRVQPGQAVIASLGQVASFDNSRGLFGRGKTAEVVVVVACRPSPNNTLNGRPIVLASAAQPRRSTSASPIEKANKPQAKPSRLPKPFFVPPQLTAPVD